MVSIAGQDRRVTVGQPGPVRELVMSMPVAVAFVRGPDLVYEFANDEYRRVVGVRTLAGRCAKYCPNCPPNISRPSAR